MTRSEISSLVPSTLVAKLKNSHLLFLGYSMRDWNLRVIMHRIWGEQKLTFASWSVQLHPAPMEQHPLVRVADRQHLAHVPAG